MIGFGEYLAKRTVKNNINVQVKIPGHSIHIAMHVFLPPMYLASKLQNLGIVKYYLIPIC